MKQKLVALAQLYGNPLVERSHLCFCVGTNGMLKNKRINKLVADWLTIESKNAKEAGKLAFMARAMVMATLPHSKSDNVFFERRNGHYKSTMTANPKFGLPYGSVPRMLLAWMTTEAVITKSPDLELGKSFSQFLKKISLHHSGGKRGSANQVREQMMRLLTCSISCVYYDKRKGVCAGDQYHISRSFALWWRPFGTDKKDFKPGSKITLAKDFFDELVTRPVPIDFKALGFLRKSPLQMDIYVWLTYRFSFLKKETFVPWGALKEQFGSDYANDGQGKRNFKKKFLQALKHVWVVYPGANVTPQRKGVHLCPSDTHVKKKLGKERGNNPVDN